MTHASTIIRIPSAWGGGSTFLFVVGRGGGDFEKTRIYGIEAMECRFLCCLGCRIVGKASFSIVALS